MGSKDAVTARNVTDTQLTVVTERADSPRSSARHLSTYSATAGNCVAKTDDGLETGAGFETDATLNDSSVAAGSELAGLGATELAQPRGELSRARTREAD